MDYAALLRHVRLADAAIYSACRIGSRVYGSAGPRSDEDFFVVLRDEGARDDLLFRGGANFVVKGLRRYRDALEAQTVLALEAFFAPPEARLKEGRPALRYTLDHRKLAAAACARAGADFEKAARIFRDEPHAAKKQLFHALRVLVFARQIAATGRIGDFTEAAPLWHALAARTDDGWEAYERVYRPLYDELRTALEACATRARPSKRGVS